MASKSTSAVCQTWRLFARPDTRQSTINTRRCSSKQETEKSKTQRSSFRPAPSPTHDWIGPPNPLSNLRPIVYRVPPDETGLEARLRLLRQDTEDWNHRFWTTQNITFSKGREAYIVSQLTAKGLSLRDEQGRKHSLNSEEMAVFYKSFLDTNRVRHASYNNEWYRRNFTITLLMARVALYSFWKTVRDRKKDKTHTT